MSERGYDSIDMRDLSMDQCFERLADAVVSDNPNEACTALRRGTPPDLIVHGFNCAAVSLVVTNVQTLVQGTPSRQLAEATALDVSKGLQAWLDSLPRPGSAKP